MNQPLGIASRPLGPGADAAATHGYTHDQRRPPTEVARQPSHEQIAHTLTISKGVVAKYVGLASAAGLDWAHGRSRRSGARTPADGGFRAARRRARLGPHPPRTRRKGVTLMLLWQEYARRPPAGPHLALHAVLRALQGLRRAAQALDAPAPARRREAVHRLRRLHGAAGRRRARPGLRLGHGRVQLHVRLRDRRAALGRLDRLDGAGAGTSTEACRSSSCPTTRGRDRRRRPLRAARQRHGAGLRPLLRHLGASSAARVLRKTRPPQKVAVQVVDRWILARLRHHRFETVTQVDAAIAGLLPC